MADPDAASTLTILHDGQLYRSDKQTAELLRHVQHWQASGDRALEAALIDHGLKAGRIQPGPVGRAQAETAHRQPLMIDAPKPMEQSSPDGRVADVAPADRTPHPVSQARREPADGTVEEHRASHQSWFTRTVQRVERALAWEPPPAPYHTGQSITYRDRSGQAHAATITRIEPERDLDFLGWQYSFRVSVHDPASQSGERALTPKELKTALVLRSATAALTHRDASAQTLPTRQSVDPPQRQPGSTWNTAVHQAWPGTVRDRAPAEQRAAVIAWPVNQPRPLAFHATQNRGLGQGQE